MKLPNGFSTVNSYIIVRNPTRYIEFLVKGLGAIELGRTLQGTRIANARIKLGESTVMVSEASEQFPATKSFFYMYAENADEAYKRAIENGAQGLMEPMDMPYGDRHGMFQDPEGNFWAPSLRFDDSKFNSGGVK